MRFCRSSPLRWWTASPVAVELMGRLDELDAPLSTPLSVLARPAGVQLVPG
jgi:hypothetical protein